ncbi:MAG: hypothetical protein ABJA60_12555 [Nitrosospira sp.]
MFDITDEGIVIGEALPDYKGIMSSRPQSALKERPSQRKNLKRRHDQPPGATILSDSDIHNAVVCVVGPSFDKTCSLDMRFVYLDLTA